MNREPCLNWKQKTSRVVYADFAEWFIADQYQDPDLTSVIIANPDTTLEVKKEFFSVKNSAYLKSDTFLAVSLLLCALAVFSIGNRNPIGYNYPFIRYDWS